MIDFSDLEITEFVPEEDDPVNIICSAVMTLRTVCDGATSDDAQGFAAFDVYHGHRIAALISEGEDLHPVDVIWIQQHLPYYKNTQLSYINWDKWEEYCTNAWEYYAYAEAEAEKTRKEELRKFEEEKAVILKAIDDLPDFQIRNHFLRIPRAQVDKKDYAFLVNLQTWGRPFTEKQMPYVKKFLAKYWKLLEGQHDDSQH